MFPPYLWNTLPLAFLLSRRRVEVRALHPSPPSSRTHNTKQRILTKQTQFLAAFHQTTNNQPISQANEDPSTRPLKPDRPARICPHISM